jgi:Mrp family chromosome partitioning ATPase
VEPASFFAASRVHIVAGKGGVGKTSVTAALALAAAQLGLKVLVVDIDGKGGVARLFGTTSLSYAPTPLAKGVDIRQVTPDEALLVYLGDHGMGRIAKRLVSTGVLDVVATAIPGIKDILTLGKVKQLERNAATTGDYDVILVDAPAAGHAITFLKSASGLLDAVSSGPIHTQASDVRDMLSDGDRCQVVLVTLAEETPVNELIDTAYALEEQVGVKLGPLIVNGIYAPVEGLDTPTTNATLAAAAEFRLTRTAQQQSQLWRLREALPLPVVQLPFVFSAELGRDEIAALAVELLTAIERLP